LATKGNKTEFAIMSMSLSA